MPGFIDTHSHSYQGILRNILTNGRVDPDYNRDIIAPDHARLYAGGRLCRHARHRARHDRHGHNGVVDVSQVNNTPEHSDALIKASAGCGHSRGLRLFSGSRGAGHAASAGRGAAQDRRISARRTSCLPSRSASVPIQAMFQVARDNGVPVVAHLRNTLPQRDDGARLKTLAQASLLTTRATSSSISCTCRPSRCN